MSENKNEKNCFFFKTCFYSIHFFFIYKFIMMYLRAIIHLLNVGKYHLSSYNMYLCTNNHLSFLPFRKVRRRHNFPKDRRPEKKSPSYIKENRLANPPRLHYHRYVACHSMHVHRLIENCLLQRRFRALVQSWILFKGCQRRSLESGNC